MNKIDHPTDQGTKGGGQYDAQGVFLIFANQIDAQLRHSKCTILKCSQEGIIAT